VRAVVVVFGDERGEAALLGAPGAGRRPGRFPSEDGMKLFVRAVLVGAPRRDAFGPDAEAQPPDGEPRQATEPGRAERRAIVAANAVG
jgi:hypothetical protein